MKRTLLTLIMVGAIATTASAQEWVAAYSVDGGDNGLANRVRGVTALGENAVAGALSRGAVYSGIAIYPAADGTSQTPIQPATWINPDLTSDTNPTQYGWGIEVEPTQGAILATFGNSGCVIVSYDTSGNPLRYAANTKLTDSAALDYTSALDVDAAGNVYVACYVATFDTQWTSAGFPSGTDILILPPITNAGWIGTNVNDNTGASGHQPTPLAGINGDTIDATGEASYAGINEGLAVTPDGNTLFLSDRGAGGGTYVHKLTANTNGDPSAGYTHDNAFVLEFAGLPANGAAPNCRGIDVSDDGGQIFVLWDNNSGTAATDANDAVLSVHDAATGAMITSVDLKALCAGLSGTTDAHNGPYDIDVVSSTYGSPTAADNSPKSIWIAHNLAWYIDKIIWTPVPPSVSDWAVF